MVNHLECDCLSNVAYALVLRENGVLIDEQFALLKVAIQEFLLLTSDGSLENSFSTLDVYLNERLGSLKARVTFPSVERFLLNNHLFLKKSVLRFIAKIILLGEACAVFSPNFLLDTLINLRSFYRYVTHLPWNFFPQTSLQEWKRVASFLGMHLEGHEVLSKLYRIKKAFEVFSLEIEQVFRDLNNFVTEYLKLDFSLSPNLSSFEFEKDEADDQNSLQKLMTDSAKFFQEAENIIGSYQRLFEGLMIKEKQPDQLTISQFSKRLALYKRWSQALDKSDRKCFNRLIA